MEDTGGSPSNVDIRSSRGVRRTSSSFEVLFDSRETKIIYAEKANDVRVTVESLVVCFLRLDGREGVI